MAKKKEQRYELTFGSLVFDPMSDKDSGYGDDNDFYHIKDLIEAVKDQGVKETKIHVPSMRFYNRWKELNALTMATVYLRIRDADTSIPIIINWDNEILDGSHRLCKAILEDIERLPCYRIDMEKVEPTKKP